MGSDIGVSQAETQRERKSRECSKGWRQERRVISEHGNQEGLGK